MEQGFLDQVAGDRHRSGRFARGAPTVATHRWTPVAVVAAALGVPLVVVLVSPVHFAYPASSTRVALETGAAFSALLSTYLLLGRCRDAHRLDRQLLGAALVTLAATSILLAAVLTVAPGPSLPVPLYTCTLAGAALLALAAFAPAGGRRSRAPALPRALAAWALALAASYFLVRLTIGGPLPPADMETLDGDAPFLGRRAGVLVIHLAAASAFMLAAVGFVRGYTRRGDDLLRWLALAAVSMALARLGYFLFPPVPASWVHVGDLLRALFFVLVLAGVGRWVRRYWSGLAATAVADERRRIARELHDGVAQELALIRRRAPVLAHRPDADLGREIAAAASRALLESRRAIETLSQPADESLDEALAREAEHVVAGTGVEVSLRLAPGVQVQPEVLENLVRIAREAMANAAHHARPGTIRLELSGGRPLHLRVVDDGVGFELGRSTPPAGFGLVGMRERAAVIGADLTLSSRPGMGTEVRVELP